MTAAGAGFRVAAFLSGFVAAGDSIAAGSFATGSFTTGASAFGARSFMAGASVFGARGATGFTSAGAFLSGAFLLGDSSGVGCWAITAPASAREATISKLVNFFIMFSVLVVDGGDLFNARRFPLPAMLRMAMQAGSAQSIDRLTLIIRASLPIRSYRAVGALAL